MRPLSICGAIALGLSVSLGLAFATRAAEDDALLRDARRLFVPLPKDMATAERSIVAFLGSLTGPLPENFASAPALPAER